MALKGTEKTDKLTRGEASFLTLLKTETSLGACISKDFARKIFNSQPSEGKSLDEVLTNLCRKGYLLHFQYVNEHIYVPADPRSAKSFLLHWYESEIKNIKNQIRNAKSEGDKQKYRFQESILGSIAKPLEELAAKRERMTEVEAGSFLKDRYNTRTADQLVDRIRQRSKNFPETFNALDLAVGSQLVRETAIGEVTPQLIEETLEALAITGRIIMAEVSEAERYYITPDLLNQEKIFQLQHERDKNRRVEKKYREEGKLSEYTEYIKLDNLVKAVEEWQVRRDRKKTNPEPGLVGLNSLEDLDDKPVSKSERTKVKGGGSSPDTQFDDIAGASIDEVSSGFTGSNIRESEKQAELSPEELKSIFVEDMDLEQLLRELLDQIKREASREELRNYFEAMNASNEIKQAAMYYRIFFQCLSILLRIPDNNNENIYRLGKAIFKKIDRVNNPSLINEVFDLIENAHEHYLKTEEEKLLFARFENI